ncbi:MAG TPA: hypothetical protein VES88_17315 [Gemmatimonadaceae bacterium]|nr:hypothetical protein [Gemmatimonadaceae bacterium]
MKAEGYPDVHAFVRESSDTRAEAIIAKYLNSAGKAKLFDGLLRPYSDPKARWYFLAWMLRDAPAQRLGPLLSGLPGKSLTSRKAYLLNQIRKFVEPLFPNPDSWDWPAISEVMLARLEGSRRALKGTLFEEIIRRNLRALFEAHGIALSISDGEIRIHDETYDVRISGPQGSILMPVKTRETMGGGHALLFTRDIHKSITVAEDNGYRCVPIVIAESWGGDLSSLRCEKHIYIQANPNQIAAIEPQLVSQLTLLLPYFSALL